MAITKCSTKLVFRIVLDATEIAGVRYRTCAKKCAVTASKDVLDNFTEKLIEEKTAKWKTRNSGLKERCSSTGINQKTQIPTGNAACLDGYLIKAILSKHCECAISLLKLYQQRNEYPSRKVLLEAASFLARLGDKKGLEIVQQLGERADEEEFNNQAQYKHYIAEALWKSGNIEAALNIFAEVYSNHSSLRRKIRTMTRFLFSECILHRSEASLVLIKGFAHTLAEKYGDLFFLSCLWHYCFVSERFNDQQLAADLLKENQNLREDIKKRAPYLALKALKTHQVNVVQRILEVLLLYDMMPQYTQVLRALFDYKCYQGDVKGCCAVLESALQFNISLNIGEQLHFLYLLASDKERVMLKKLSEQCKHRSIVVPRFNLKF